MSVTTMKLNKTTAQRISRVRQPRKTMGRGGVTRAAVVDDRSATISSAGGALEGIAAGIHTTWAEMDTGEVEDTMITAGISTADVRFAMTSTAGDATVETHAVICMLQVAVGMGLGMILGPRRAMEEAGQARCRSAWTSSVASATGSSVATRMMSTVVSQVGGTSTVGLARVAVKFAMTSNVDAAPGATAAATCTTLVVAVATICMLPVVVRGSTAVATMEDMVGKGLPGDRMLDRGVVTASMGMVQGAAGESCGWFMRAGAGWSEDSMVSYCWCTCGPIAGLFSVLLPSEWLSRCFLRLQV
eukprot:m.560593 g.560593  ORF g.560593 m.560593 type:complete len:302 (-) comp22211_c0_seq2:490-1395(-)